MTKKQSLKEEFYKKFGVEVYHPKLGFVSSGKTISSTKMWDWIESKLTEIIDSVPCEEKKETYIEVRIGRDLNGEEIWKTTSDNPEHKSIRINHITRKSQENMGYNKQAKQVQQWKEKVKESLK